jgi:transcriptional regulator with AAA-type ATPase domain
VAELFGVAAGAFTDAERAKPGLVYVGFVVREDS